MRLVSRRQKKTNGDLNRSQLFWLLALTKIKAGGSDHDRAGGSENAGTNDPANDNSKGFFEAQTSL